MTENKSIKFVHFLALILFSSLLER